MKPFPLSKIRLRAGTASVEFAIVLVLLVPMLIGVWEIGRLVNIQQRVVNAAREGARQASTGEKTTAEVKQFVLDYLKVAGITKITKQASTADDVKAGGKVYVEVKVFNLTGQEVKNADARDALQNYRLQVTVTILFRDVELSPTNYFLEPDRTVTSTVHWICMKDVPLQVNQDIPLY
jgi:Flp pilus assembly protein TadG